MAKTGDSEFLSTFKTNPELLKKAKAMKDAKDPNARPDIPDGNYVAKYTSYQTGARKGVPYVRLRFTVTRGPYTGTMVSTAFDLGITKPDPKRSEEENGEFTQSILNRLAVALQRLGSKVKIDGPDSILAALQELDSNPPSMDVTVRTSPSGYLNVFINRKVEDGPAVKQKKPVTEEVEELDEEIEVVTDEEEEEPEETQTSEEPEETDGTGEPPVEKGDVVYYKAKGANAAEKFTVSNSDPEARTCSLKNSEGKTVKFVSWSAVEFVYDSP